MKSTVYATHGPPSSFWIVNLDDVTSKLARWRLRLMELAFEIVDKTRIKHRAPDALLSLPTNGSNRAMF